MVGNAPQTISEVLLVFYPALSKGQAKSDHQSFDVVVLWKRISSANVRHSQKHSLFDLRALHFLKQSNEEAGCALIDQFVPEDSVFDNYVGEEPHGLIGEEEAEFEEFDEGGNALAAGDVVVERSIVGGD